jgi:hypothetical protein
MRLTVRRLNRLQIRYLQWAQQTTPEALAERPGRVSSDLALSANWKGPGLTSAAIHQRLVPRS